MHKVIETRLFKLLKTREPKDNFEANEVSSVVNRIVSDSFPILQQVSRNFPLYTLHDPDHGYRVAENIYKLLPKNTLSNLNSIEISILIYTAYFHDIGMASSQDEFYKWIESDEYHNFIGTNDKWSREIHRIDMMERHREYEEREKSKSSKNKTKTPSTELRRLQDIIYTEYLLED
ncbi:MAG: HD domain-containing protein [Desulfobacterales bacterium]|nr:HD domain-containing protein [Desulfobacterales bacterium]